MALGTSRSVEFDVLGDWQGGTLGRAGVGSHSTHSLPGRPKCYGLEYRAAWL